MPVCIVLDRISIDGLIRPAMRRQIGLSVAFDTELTHPQPAFDGVFKNTGGYDSAIVDHVFWFRDIYGNDPHPRLHRHYPPRDVALSYAL